jgi:UDP-N-acetylmuramoyl-tripeptide--D-alanyl-D-alanine ligase
LIAAALAQLGRRRGTAVHQTTGNLNNHLGVPMTLLAAPEDAAAVVVEMGTSGPGEIAVLADIARPDARLIVNIGEAHLEELGGLEGVAREKGALFDASRDEDVLAVNLDDPFVRAMAGRGRRVTWGTAEGADIRLVDVSVDAASLTTIGTWDTPAGRLRAELGAPGRHIAHNAAGALAIAFGLGLDLREAAADLIAFAPVGMRLRRVDLPGGVVAINDAYNANPTSMRASLELLASMPGRRIAVLGDMLELGPGEAAFHLEIIALARELGIDRVVGTGPRMLAAGDGDPWFAEDGVSLAARLASELTAGDRVLFKGSRGARVERVLEAVAAALAAKEGA